MEKKINSIFPVLSSVMSFLMAGIYVILRYPFDQDYSVVFKVLGISLSLINIPYGFYFLLKERIEINFYFFNSFAIILLLMILAISGLFNIAIIGYLFLFLGTVTFWVTISHYVRIINYSAFFHFGFIAIFSIWLAGIVWEGKNLTPMFLEKIISGFYMSSAGIDNLFHMSIAQMIKTYDIPSTGLDELPYLPYHYGSHFLFAQISKVLSISIIDMYHFGFPVIFFPLFFHLVFLVFHQFKELNIYTERFDYFFWILLFAVFIGVLPAYPGGIAFRTSLAWNSIFGSESYLVSMIFLFMALSLTVIPIVKNGELKISPQLVFLFILLLVFIGFSKISTLFILDIILGYLYIKCRLYKLRLGNFLFLSAAVLSILLFFLFNDSTVSDTGTIDFLSFYKNFINSSFLSFIILSFLWTFVLIGIWLFLYFNGIKVSSILMELQILIAIMGFLPGMFLNIAGGSAYFFSNIQHWTALFFIAYYFSFIIQGLKKTSLRLAYSIGLLVIIASSLNIKRSFEVLCTDNYITKSHIMDNVDRSNYMLKIRGIIANHSIFFDNTLRAKLLEDKDFSKLKFLTSLDNLDNKERKILFIEEGNFLSKYFQCYKAPFFISVATGMATFDGFSVKRCSCQNYGFEYYTRDRIISKDQNICSLLQSPIFKEVVYCNLAEKSYTVKSCK